MKRTRRETFRVSGEELLKKIRELVREGNIRTITISDKNGKPIVVLPLTIGVLGAIVAPTLAAVGAIAALVTECTVTVEREEN
jgi:hypothetical protein